MATEMWKNLDSGFPDWLTVLLISAYVFLNDWEVPTGADSFLLF